MSKRLTTAKYRHGKLLLEKRAFLLCALAAIAVIAAFTLAGCKYSDALTEHAENPDSEVDESADPTYQDNPEVELELDLAELTLDEADDVDTQVASLPHYDPDAPDNGPTKRRVQGETSHDEKATQGNEENDSSDYQGGGDGDQGGEESSEGKGSTDSPDEDDEEDSLDGEGEHEDSAVGSQNGSTPAINPDGDPDQIPEGTVAAVGEYATIAQMLGGAGGLVACDESWKQARTSDGCFAGELDRVNVAFSGDGTESGSADIDALINTYKPSVILWDSTANVPALTDAEISKLESNNIKVQVMPHIGEQYTEDYSMKLAVAEVATVLKGASGLQYSPADVLQKYNDYHDQVLTQCCSTNNGYAYKYCGMTALDQLYQETSITGLGSSTTNRRITAFVNSMRSGRSSEHVSVHTSGKSSETTTVDASDGIGLSSAAPGGYLVLDYYLQLAGVVNNAYDVTKPQSEFVVSPALSFVDGLGAAGAYGTRSLDGSSALINWTYDDAVESNWYRLGGEGFDTLLVSNADIQGSIKLSANKSNGLYHMGSPYKVIVVPSGIAGSWSGGHVDSFLLTPWAFRIQGEGNLSEAAKVTESFYKTFLRCDNWKGAVADWDSSETVD